MIDDILINLDGPGSKTVSEMKQIGSLFGCLANVVPAAPAVKKPRAPKALTSVQKRFLAMPVDEEDISIMYQHTVLCQTSLPYRDPKKVRLWERSNGMVSSRIQAGAVFSNGEWVEKGLPFGPKPRLILFHLNAESKRTGSPLIELEDSLTAFVRKTLGMDSKGKTIVAVKEQLSRLAAADFRFGMGSVTVKDSVIAAQVNDDGSTGPAFDLWCPKDYRQRVLWPTTIRFSDQYFNSLMAHAVPLNETAIKCLANSAMGLDIYAWLAQRLHRVKDKSALVPWVSLKQQFGQGYAAMSQFRRVFLRTLKQVHVTYKDARFSPDCQGLRLFNSPPPVPPRYLPSCMKSSNFD